MESNKYKFWLDTVRFFAAFIVVLAHAKYFLFGDYGHLALSSQNIFNAAFFFLCRVSNEAVIIFFVLSGFLVGGANVNKMQEGKFNYIEYSIDRLARIYVPLIPALVFSGAVYYSLGNKINIPDFFGNVFQLQGVFVDVFSANGPLWSLSYECWFYLALPVFYCIVNGSKFSLVWFLVLVAFFAVFVKLDSTYLFCWLIGLVAFFNAPKKFQWSKLFFSLLIVLTGLLCIQFGTPSTSTLNTFVISHIPSLGVSRLIFSVGCAFFLRIIVVAEPKSSWVIRFEHCGRFLAKFSFTLYLTHYPLLSLLAPYFKITGGVIDVFSYVKFFFVVLVCCVFSYVFYLFFERNTQRMKNYIRRFWVSPSIFE